MYRALGLGFGGCSRIIPLPINGVIKLKLFTFPAFSELGPTHPSLALLGRINDTA